MISWKIAIVTLLSLFNLHYNLYANSFAVVEVTEDYVLCVDFSGNEWAFDNVTDDWFEGDIVSCIMCDMGTEEIYDDEIVTADYSGWVAGAWGYDWESGEEIVYFEY